MFKNLPDNFGAVVISILVTVGFFAVAMYLIIHGVKDDPIMQGLIGTVSAMFVAVVQFWIGSSIGSKNKDTALAAAATPPILTPSDVHPEGTLFRSTGSPPAAALILGAALSLGLLLASHGPASAAQCVPYPQCMGGYKAGASGTTGGGLLGPGSITVADLQNALTDANAQTPNLPVCSATLPLGASCEPIPYNASVTAGSDTRHGNCWAALIDFDNQFQAQNVLPEKPGLALLQQKIFDDQHMTSKNLIPDYVAHNCVDTFNDAGKNLADVFLALGLKKPAL